LSNIVVHDQIQLKEARVISIKYNLVHSDFSNATRLLGNDGLEKNVDFSYGSGNFSYNPETKIGELYVNAKYPSDADEAINHPFHIELVMIGVFVFLKPPLIESDAIGFLKSNGVYLLSPFVRSALSSLRGVCDIPLPIFPLLRPPIVVLDKTS